MWSSGSSVQKNQLQTANLNPIQNYSNTKTVYIVTFYVWTLNGIGQLPELTTSAANHKQWIKMATIVESDLKAIFSIASAPKYRSGPTTPFTGLFHFTFVWYFIMMSVKQGRIKYYNFSLWYDSTWDSTTVFQTIGGHENRYHNKELKNKIAVYWYYNFSLWYDSTWDSTTVFQTIGGHENRYHNNELK